MSIPLYSYKNKQKQITIENVMISELQLNFASNEKKAVKVHYILNKLHYQITESNSYEQ